ncbi:tRNA pseudouridine synthase A, partial [Caerostris darwini]
WSPFMSYGLEFEVIKIKGKSFILPNQIRKLVGLSVVSFKEFDGISILKESLRKERIDIPKAPGLGLMLEELHYDWYNKKFGTDGIHDPLTWTEYDDVIETFKKEKICENIAKTEREEKSMLQWLETLPHHSYDVRDAGPPTKLPPKQTIITSDNSESINTSDNSETVSTNDNSEAVNTNDNSEASGESPKLDNSNNDVNIVNKCNDSIPSQSESTSITCNNSQETEIKCES